MNCTKISDEGVGEMDCLQIQKGDSLNWGNWKTLYSPIVGFEFEPGYICKLVAREQKLELAEFQTEATSIKLSQIKGLEKSDDNRLQINNVCISKK